MRSPDRPRSSRRSRARPCRSTARSRTVSTSRCRSQTAAVGRPHLVHPAHHGARRGPHDGHLRGQRARGAHRHAVQLRLPGLRRDPPGGRERPDARYHDEGRRQHLLHVQRRNNGIVDSTGKSATAAGSSVLRRRDRSDESDLRGDRAARNSRSTPTPTPSTSTPRSPTASRRATRSSSAARAISSTRTTTSPSTARVFTFNALGGRHLHGHLRRTRCAGGHRGADADHADAVLHDGGRPARRSSTSSTIPGGLNDIVLGVMGRLYTYDPVQADRSRSPPGTTSTPAPVQTGVGFVSNIVLRLRHLLH